jgi:hypothetical protein
MVVRLTPERAARSLCFHSFAARKRRSAGSRSPLPMQPSVRQVAALWRM